MFLRLLLWKADEAGRFLFFYSPKNTFEATFFISSKTNEATFLFILSTFLLFKSEKKTDEGHLKQMGDWA